MYPLIFMKNKWRWAKCRGSITCSKAQVTSEKYKQFIVVRIWVLEKYWHREDEAGMERIIQGVQIMEDTGWYAVPKSLDGLEDSRE